MNVFWTAICAAYLLAFLLAAVENLVSRRALHLFTLFGVWFCAFTLIMFASGEWG